MIIASLNTLPVVSYSYFLIMKKNLELENKIGTY